jgi:hypothetical protein
VSTDSSRIEEGEDHGNRAPIEVTGTPAVTGHHQPHRVARAFATLFAVFALLTLSLGSALARSSVASQVSLPAAPEREWTPTLKDVPFPRTTESDADTADPPETDTPDEDANEDESTETPDEDDQGEDEAGDTGSDHDQAGDSNDDQDEAGDDSGDDDQADVQDDSHDTGDHDEDGGDEGGDD